MTDTEYSFYRLPNISPAAKKRDVSGWKNVDTGAQF